VGAGGAAAAAPRRPPGGAAGRGAPPRGRRNRSPSGWSPGCEKFVDSLPLPICRWGREGLQEGSARARTRTVTHACSRVYAWMSANAPTRTRTSSSTRARSRALSRLGCWPLLMQPPLTLSPHLPRLSKEHPQTCARARTNRRARARRR
jgi:hypothetical protein